MIFVDEADIFVRSGKGGPGCVSFRREKYVPKGGPDGGDGGRGGDVIFEVDDQLNTLTVFSGKHHWLADNGQPGEGKNKNGKNGSDLIIKVPAGTQIYDRDTKLMIKELTASEQRVVLLKGGQGGLGNAHFVSSTRQAPRYAQPGEPSSERWLHLELKLIADVGLVGLPNAGKSTLLSRATKAKPKIASYPFTTLTPQLGIVRLSDYREFTLADIPGLIEGAHEGVGLGVAFLKHIERTRAIIHLIDVCPVEGQPTPIEAYNIIRSELSQYSEKLSETPELIVANKMDLSDSEQHLEQFK